MSFLMNKKRAFTLVELLIAIAISAFGGPAGGGLPLRRKSTPSFTLVELLIVIAILAVLAAAVVIVLNPAELLSQARDGERSQDIKTLGDALAILVVDNSSVSLGTYKTVYISIPDTSSTCANITDLPTLPSGWTYHCVTEANLKNIDSTGWLPLDLSSITGGSPIPSLPTDPTNNATYHYSYIPSSSTYGLSANIESVKHRQSNQSGVFTTNFIAGSNPNLASIPQGGDWIRVPGNPDYDTEDFWVMKYEAKCVDADGLALFSPADENYDTYYDSNAPCTAANNRYISSRKDGFAIARVSHNSAKEYCESIGAHLLTNEEYMTIARNAENVGSNWSGGSKGSGYIYSGHNDGAPLKVIQASLDTDGYANTGNTSGSQRRTLTLSNGEVIWDIAGNLWENVMRTPADIQTTIDLPACTDGSTWGYCEYGSSTTPYIAGWTADVSQSYVGSSNASWNSSQGVGQIFTYKDGTDKGTTVFRRGGHWNSKTSAGIFATYLYWTGPATGDSVGFRCAR
jgi:prepilin-type N-terminal cleavage/methylation domain-containing protein